MNTARPTKREVQRNYDAIMARAQQWTAAADNCPPAGTLEFAQHMTILQAHYHDLCAQRQTHAELVRSYLRPAHDGTMIPKRLK